MCVLILQTAYYNVCVCVYMQFCDVHKSVWFYREFILFSLERLLVRAHASPAINTAARGSLDTYTQECVYTEL